jgi:fluoride exporter
MTYLIVFLGAGIGGALRHGTNIACTRLWGTAFPWGTFTVNVLGCFAMGVIASWLALRDGEMWPQHLRLFLTTGVLGGYTTFSAFSLDVALLYERGQLGLALLYALGSGGLSVAGLFLGLLAVRAWS